MAQIRERLKKDGTKSYLVRIRIKGQSDVTATFSRQTDAKRWAQQTEVEIRSGIYIKTREAQKHTLGETIERYVNDVLIHNPKTFKSYRSQLHYWKESLGEVRLSDLNTALVVQHRDKLASEYIAENKKRSPARVNRYLACLSSIISTAVKEWEWLESNPLKNVSKFKEPKGRTRFLSESERKRLLKACKNSQNKMLYLAVLMALSTGARRKEIWDLKWGDINLNKGFITFEETKNGKTRTVPLQGLGLDCLREYSSIRRIDTDLLFPSKFNPEKSIDLRAPFIKALKEAKIDDFTWHDLRRSCARYLTMNGVPARTIAEILGHSSLQMVLRYSHLSPDHLTDVMSDMSRKIFG